ncbi:MAG: SDR family NAD(P)-dependent oxidoreductase [Xanthomonadales bacterium]|jgi:nucleoside-diphosphate-sugar epimerase|nr:SDR family NAD(P)-dependent oxidoreductase [Xanthomonadales bacterium]
MTLLVVGAGDLGLRVAAAGVAAGRVVLAIKRTPVALPAGVQGLWGDVAALDPGLLPAVDAVLYCLTPDRRDPESYRQCYVERLRGLLALFDQCGHAPRLLFASSTAVYPVEDGRTVDEHYPIDVERERLPFNGQLLREAEWLLHGREACALRIGGIYGPGRDMLLRRLRTPGATVQREPPLWTNRMHIADVARAVGFLLDLPSLPVAVNLVDDASVPQAEVLDGLAAMLGLPQLPGSAPTAGLTQGKRVSNALLRGLGFRCRYPGWREGYTAMLEATAAP